MSDNDDTISYTPQETEELRQELIQKRIINDTIIDKMYDANPDAEYDDAEEFAEAESFLEDNPNLKEEATLNLVRTAQPGTYDCHEALDRASIIMNLLDTQLLEHSAIIANPAWFKLVHDAHTHIFNLYQLIGAVHLEAIPDNIIDLIELAKEKPNE